MFWLLNNLFNFFLKNNFFFYNFFFLNNFENTFFFDVKFKNFYKFDNVSEYKLKKNNFFNITKNMNMIINTNYSLSVNRSHLRDVFSSKKIKSYYLESFCLKIYKNLLSSIYNISLNNLGFVILDDNYKNLAPLYNYIYSEKNLMTYKKFFFVNKNYFTYYNWMYFYKAFSKKFNVSLVIVFDYYSYKYFYKHLLKMDLPLASLVPYDCHSEFVDYQIFFRNYDFEKYLLLNLVSSTHFLAINFNNYVYKKKFIYLFYNFYNKKNFKI